MERLVIYDSGPYKYFDRYTIVFIDRERERSGLYEALAASDNPFSPSGAGMHTSAMRGRHLGKRVTLESLPEKVQQFINQNLGE